MGRDWDATVDAIGARLGRNWDATVVVALVRHQRLRSHRHRMCASWLAVSEKQEQCVARI